MQNNPVKHKINHFRKYWKYSISTKENHYIILYHIENLIVYTLHTQLKTINIVPNLGDVIHPEAKAIDQEEYEKYLLKYMT